MHSCVLAHGKAVEKSWVPNPWDIHIQHQDSQCPGYSRVPGEGRVPPTQPQGRVEPQASPGSCLTAFPEQLISKLLSSASVS